MSTFKKKIILSFIGLMAGLAAWPVVEILLVIQTVFFPVIVLALQCGITMENRVAIYCYTNGVIFIHFDPFSGI